MTIEKLIKGLEPFIEECDNKGFPVRIHEIKEAYPGVSDTSYVIYIEPQFHTLNCSISEILDKLLPIFNETVDSKYRFFTFSLTIIGCEHFPAEGSGTVEVIVDDEKVEDGPVSAGLTPNLLSIEEVVNSLMYHYGSDEQNEFIKEIITSIHWHRAEEIKRLKDQRDDAVAKIDQLEESIDDITKKLSSGWEGNTM